MFYVDFLTGHTLRPGQEVVLFYITPVSEVPALPSEQVESIATYYKFNSFPIFAAIGSDGIDIPQDERFKLSIIGTASELSKLALVSLVNYRSLTSAARFGTPSPLNFTGLYKTAYLLSASPQADNNLKAYQRILSYASHTDTHFLTDGQHKLPLSAAYNTKLVTFDFWVKMHNWLNPQFNSMTFTDTLSYQSYAKEAEGFFFFCQALRGLNKPIMPSLRAINTVNKALTEALHLI